MHNNTRQPDLFSNAASHEFGGGPEEEAMDDAAEALRETEIEAVQETIPTSPSDALEHMSIDDLRKLAAKLDIPDRGQIIEQEELIAEIRKRL
jgi:hypothetical protein